MVKTLLVSQCISARVSRLWLRQVKCWSPRLSETSWLAPD